MREYKQNVKKVSKNSCKFCDLNKLRQCKKLKAKMYLSEGILRLIQ